jgi:micrococcal nuclease
MARMAKRKLLTKKNISLITTLLLLLVGFIAQRYGLVEDTSQKVAESDPGRYSVTRFIDGDTFAIDMNGTKETVRMIGVDTPETHKPNTPVQCYGPAAAAYTKNLIGKQTVRLQADPTNQNRDRYGRLLRYVYLPDNKLVQKELIAGGYGFAYTSFPFQKKDEFVTAEKQAEQGAKGLWGNCTVTDSNDRKQTNVAE